MRDRNVTESGTGNTKLSIHGHGYYLFTEHSVQLHERIARVNVSKCTTGLCGSKLGLFL